MGCIPVGMEQFPASNMSQMEYIKMMMDDCDYYVLILAGKWVVCGLLKNFKSNGVQREHNKKLNNGLPILHKVPPKRDYGRYFCIMAEKGGTSTGA